MNHGGLSENERIISTHLKGEMMIDHGIVRSYFQIIPIGMNQDRARHMVALANFQIPDFFQIVPVHPGVSSVLP